MELKNLCVVSRIALSELQDIYKKVTFASGGRRRKRFCLSQLFNNVETGKLQTMIAIPGGKTPVLSSSMMNNGVMGYYDIPAVYENKITIAYRGAGAGFVSYHPEKFNATLNCGILNEKFKLTPNIALYLCAIIRAVCLKKYNYKEIITPSRLLTEFIFLPSDSSGNPDWDYMENYIKELTTKTSKSIDLLSKVS